MWVCGWVSDKKDFNRPKPENKTTFWGSNGATIDTKLSFLTVL